jgi:hypothetical protein
MWQAEHYTVDLGAAGYATAKVTVVVNPRGRTVRQYWEVMGQMAREGETEASQDQYFATLAELLVAVEREGETIPLGTAQAVQQFEAEDDPQLLALALHALWAERQRRRENAAATFRAPNR